MEKVKAFSTCGMICGAILVFIALGVMSNIPSSEIGGLASTSQNGRQDNNAVRYVGGDAYNFIIEASIRGGEIAGRTSATAILLVGGLIIFFGSLISLGFALDKSKNDNILNSPALAQVQPPVENELGDAPAETPTAENT